MYRSMYTHFFCPMMGPNPLSHWVVRVLVCRGWLELTCPLQAWQSHPSRSYPLDIRHGNDKPRVGKCRFCFGDFGHDLQIAVGDCIPNSWVMFNWDIYQPCKPPFHHFAISPLIRSDIVIKKMGPLTVRWFAHEKIRVRFSIALSRDKRRGDAQPMVIHPASHLSIPISPEVDPEKKELLRCLEAKKEIHTAQTRADRNMVNKLI